MKANSSKENYEICIMYRHMYRTFQVLRRASSLQAEVQLLDKQEQKENLYLRAIAGYQRGSVPNFVAVWNR